LDEERDERNEILPKPKVTSPLSHLYLTGETTTHTTALLHVLQARLHASLPSSLPPLTVCSSHPATSLPSSLLNPTRPRSLRFSLTHVLLALTTTTTRLRGFWMMMTRRDTLCSHRRMRLLDESRACFKACRQIPRPSLPFWVTT
jgi:hypothetical protein